MPSPGDTCLTNLENPERMAKEALQAESDHMANPTPQTEATKRLAKARLEGNTATLELMEREFGPVTIGKPRKTQWKTSEQLEAQGYVGIYRRG
jgi:hypothetical protein